MFMRSAVLALAALSSAPSTLAIKPGTQTCGAEVGTQCIPVFDIRDGGKLRRCLEGREGDPAADPRWQEDVTIIEYTPKNPLATNFTVKKLTFPEEGDAYSKAKFSAHGATRYPAGILYAENEDEVVEAIDCARKAGYQISPRGRAHSYQGLGSMDGYLVVDLSLMCDPDAFEVKLVGDEDYTGPETWLLGEDQKVLGSITSGAGCTNAVMLAYTAGVEQFKGDNGGIYLIGSCPSVGIVGYATGGGQGDTTPYVGLGIDDVIQYRIVTSDGIVKNASATENEDLFFYLKGGGSGIGVITAIETAVIESPKPPEGKTRMFTSFFYAYSADEEKAKTFLTRLQDFLVPPLPFNSQKYLEEIKEGSARYGGGAAFNLPAGIMAFNGIFLGSKAELDETLDKYGLLDKEIFQSELSVYETDEYGKVMAVNICNTARVSGFWPLWFAPTLSFQDPLFDICEDLGIDGDICEFISDLGGRVPRAGALGCENEEFINAFVAAAGDPQSFVNRPGFQRFADFAAEFGLASEAQISDVKATLQGGLVVPRVDPEVLLDLARLGVNVNHWAHGAATLVPTDATGYSNRAEYMLLEFSGSGEKYNPAAEILVEKVYGGDPTKLRGFYNYMNPQGNPNWREYYFGDNYERLSEIKAKYDEKNMFGNPLQVEPAVPTKQDYFPNQPKDGAATSGGKKNGGIRG